MSENILFLGNKIFEIAPFFQTRPGDLGEKVHACSLRFSALKSRPHRGSSQAPPSILSHDYIPLIKIVQAHQGGST